MLFLYLLIMFEVCTIYYFQTACDAGKKIHAARSRNDQVLLDIKLFLRHELQELVSEVLDLFKLLQQKSEEHKAHLLPGYTHL